MTSKGACEGPDEDGIFTIPELHKALRSSGNGSAPGCDGLPFEFYTRWWEYLSTPLHAAFREAFLEVEEHDALCEFLHGVITLVLKPHKPPDQIRSYRPITLLNCDVKILTKAISNRLQAPLDSVIDASQSAFIYGREIGDNVPYHLGLADY